MLCFGPAVGFGGVKKGDAVRDRVIHDGEAGRLIDFASEGGAAKADAPNPQSGRAKGSYFHDEVPFRANDGVSKRQGSESVSILVRRPALSLAPPADLRKTLHQSDQERYCVSALGP